MLLMYHFTEKLIIVSIRKGWKSSFIKGVNTHLVPSFIIWSATFSAGRFDNLQSTANVSAKCAHGQPLFRFG